LTYPKSTVDFTYTNVFEFGPREFTRSGAALHCVSKRVLSNRFDIDKFEELRSSNFSVQRHEKNENQRISYAVELQVTNCKKTLKLLF